MNRHRKPRAKKRIKMYFVLQGSLEREICFVEIPADTKSHLIERTAKIRFRKDWAKMEGAELQEYGLVQIPQTIVE